MRRDFTLFMASSVLIKALISDEFDRFVCWECPRGVGHEPHHPGSRTERGRGDWPQVYRLKMITSMWNRSMLKGTFAALHPPPQMNHHGGGGGGAPRC